MPKKVIYWVLFALCHPKYEILNTDLDTCRFFTMDDYIEQRICLKFCVANGFPCADALKMLLKAFGDNALSETCAYECTEPPSTFVKWSKT